MDKKSAAFLMLGEAVVDFISTGFVSSLEDASSFEKFAGGEVANLSVNLSRLGFSVTLGSCLGNDSLGRFHQQHMRQAGIDLSLIQTASAAPTTLIPVARQTATPDFLVYRGADQHLMLTEALLDAARNADAIHTSAFALSRDPCRSTIRSILQSVAQSGKIISLDPNYHPAIHPDRADFLPILKEITAQATVVKPSLDDSQRIFGPGKEAADYLELFLTLGPEIVVLTMGEKGSLLGTASGKRFHIHTRPVPVFDVTGAGDAYWSGLLAGLVSGLDPLDSARIGQAVAEHKIGFVGPIKDHWPFNHYFQQAKAMDFIEF